MAVDTRQKRFSMMTIGEANPVPIFEADGTVDLDDRQHLLGCYSGIAFDSPGDEPVLTAPPPWRRGAAGLASGLGFE